jgi:hypothetical protein
MEFLESHWHCVLPLLGILIGAILLNRGGVKERKNEKDAGSE